MFNWAGISLVLFVDTYVYWYTWYAEARYDEDTRMWSGSSLSMHDIGTARLIIASIGFAFTFLSFALNSMSASNGWHKISPSEALANVSAIAIHGHMLVHGKNMRSSTEGITYDVRPTTAVADAMAEAIKNPHNYTGIPFEQLNTTIGNFTFDMSNQWMFVRRDHTGPDNLPGYSSYEQFDELMNDRFIVGVICLFTAVFSFLLLNMAYSKKDDKHHRHMTEEEIEAEQMIETSLANVSTTNVPILGMFTLLAVFSVLMTHHNFRCTRHAVQTYVNKYTELLGLGTDGSVSANEDLEHIWNVTYADCFDVNGGVMLAFALGGIVSLFYGMFYSFQSRDFLLEKSYISALSLVAYYSGCFSYFTYTLSLPVPTAFCHQNAAIHWKEFGSSRSNSMVHDCDVKTKDAALVSASLQIVFAVVLYISLIVYRYNNKELIAIHERAITEEEMEAARTLRAEKMMEKGELEEMEEARKTEARIQRENRKIRTIDADNPDDLKKMNEDKEHEKVMELYKKKRKARKKARLGHSKSKHKDKALLEMSRGPGRKANQISTSSSAAKLRSVAKGGLYDRHDPYHKSYVSDLNKDEDSSD